MSQEGDGKSEDDVLSADDEERASRTGRYYSWYVALVMISTYLYIVPELATIANSGFVPQGSIDVVVNERDAIREAAHGLWQNFASIVQPFANPLMRFFIVTAFVGWVLDRTLEARRRLRELE